MRILFSLALGLFVLTATAMADVTYNSDAGTFTGYGTYSGAVNVSNNLTATPAANDQTISFTNNIVSTGYFTQTGGYVVFGAGTVNSFDRLYINNGSGNGAKMTLSGSMTLAELHIANSKTTYLDITDGASLSVSGTVRLNETKNAQGIITQTGGTVSFTISADKEIRIGHYPNTGYPSRYNISGGSLSIPNTTTYVGWDGRGEVNISGGNVSLKGLSLSNSGNGRGVFTLTGGTLNLGDVGIVRNKRGASSSAAAEVYLGQGTINATATQTWGSNLTLSLNGRSVIDSADVAGGVTTFNADSGKTITIPSDITGVGALTKTGAGTLTLSNAPAYTGSTTVSAGTLTLSAGGTLYNLSGAGNVAYGANALTLSNSSNSNFSGVISGSGAVTKAGSGTLTLSGANTYTGATTVSEGTLSLSGAASMSTPSVTVNGGVFQSGVNIASTDVVVSGGTFAIGNTSNSSNITTQSLTLNSGAVHFDFNDSAVSNDYDRLQTGAITATSGTINLSFNYGDESTWWNTIGSAGVSLVSGSSLSDISSVNLTVNGAATSSWELSAQGASIYLIATGSAPAASEYWYANNTGDVGEDSWTIDGTSKQGIKLVAGNNNNVTFSKPVAMSGNGSVEVAENYSLDLSGQVSGSGALEKTGDGALTLSGNNSSYTGAATISAGTVELTGDGTLGTGAVTNNGTLKFNYSEDKTLTNAISGTGKIDNEGAGAVKLNGSFSSFTGDMAINGGNVSVLMNGTNKNFNVTHLSGSGDLELRFASGNSDSQLPNLTNDGFTGYIILTQEGNASSNKINTNTKSFKGFKFRVNSGTTVYVPSTTLEADAFISGTGNSEGLGALRLNANMSGNITLENSATIGINKAGLTVSGPIASGAAANSNVTLTLKGLNDSASATYNNVISDGTTGSTLAIAVNRGTHIFSGANSYTGGTTISTGTLRLTGAGSLGTGSVTNSGTLEFNYSVDKTLSNVISGTGTIVKQGTNAVYLDGTFTNFTGNATINGGKLSVLLGTNKSVKVNNLSGAGDLELRISNGTGNLQLTTLHNNNFTGVISLVNNNCTDSSKFYVKDSNYDGFTFRVGSGTTVYVEGNKELKGNLLLSGNGNSENRGSLRLYGNMSGAITVAENANIALDGSPTISGNISSGAASGTVTLFINGKTDGTTVTKSNSPGTFTGVISDGSTSTLGVNILYNTQTFSGANTYSGGTTITGGTLKLTGDGTMGTGAVTNNATLEFDYSEDKTLTNAISGTGTIVKQGTNTVKLDGAVTSSGNITINGGKLSVLLNSSNYNLNVNALSGSGDLELRLATGPGSGPGNSYFTPTTNNFTGKIILTKEGNRNGNKLNTNSKSYEGYTFVVNPDTTLFVAGAEFKGNIILNGAGNSEDRGALRVSAPVSGDITVMSDSLIGCDWTVGYTYLVNSAITSGAQTGEVTVQLRTASNDSSLGLTGNISDGTAGSKLGIEIVNGTTPHILSGNLSYTGATTINANAALKLTGAGANLDDSRAVIVNGTLNFADYTGASADTTLNVMQRNIMQLNNLSGTDGVIVGTGKDLILSNDELTKFIGSISAKEIVKTGDGTLQIYTGATGQVDAQSLVVSSGNLDFKGYMTGGITVDADTIFSPGNSVGEATFGGGYILNDGATLLIEQDATGMDKLTASSFEIHPNSILDLTLGSIQSGEYVILEQKNGDTPVDFGIVTIGGQTYDYSDVSFWNSLLTPESAYYWNLSVNGNKVMASLDANAVPEPSTWALLVLGVVVLFLRKRVRN